MSPFYRNDYAGPPVRRPYLFRNPIISQALSGANPLRLRALVGRFSPTSHVSRSMFANTKIRDRMTGPFNSAVPATKNAEYKNAEIRKRTIDNNAARVVSGTPFPPQNLRPISISIMDEGWVHQNVSDLEDTLSIDFIPTTLLYSPVSQVTPIKVVGANNPNYHYGGSEDTLTFKINWYGYYTDPVVKKCRFIESLCKADGWRYGPPVIKVFWGDTNRLFKDHFFVVTRAPYTMETFTKNKSNIKQEAQYFYEPSSGEIIETSMPYHLWPVHSVQTVTLKRIAVDQLTTAEIRNY